MLAPQPELYALIAVGAVVIGAILKFGPGIQARLIRPTDTPETLMYLRKIKRAQLRAEVGKKDDARKREEFEREVRRYD